MCCLVFYSKKEFDSVCISFSKQSVNIFLIPLTSNHYLYLIDLVYNREGYRQFEAAGTNCTLPPPPQKKTLSFCFSFLFSFKWYPGFFFFFAWVCVHVCVCVCVYIKIPPFLLLCAAVAKPDSLLRSSKPSVNGFEVLNYTWVCRGTRA